MSLTSNNLYIVDGHCDTVYHFRHTGEYNFASATKEDILICPQEGGVALNSLPYLLNYEFKPYQTVTRVLQLAEHFLAEMEKTVHTYKSLKRSKTGCQLQRNWQHMSGRAEPLEAGVEILHILSSGFAGVGLTESHGGLQVVE